MWQKASGYEKLETYTHVNTYACSFYSRMHDSAWMCVSIHTACRYWRIQDWWCRSTQDTPQIQGTANTAKSASTQIQFYTSSCICPSSRNCPQTFYNYSNISCIRIRILIIIVILVAFVFVFVFIFVKLVVVVAVVLIVVFRGKHAQLHAYTRDTHLSGFHAPITSSTSRDSAHVPNLNRPGNWKLKHFDKNTAYYTCSTGHKQIAVQIHSMQEQAKTPISLRCRRLQVKTARQPRRQNNCILDKKWSKLLVMHHTQSTWTCEHQTEHRRWWHNPCLFFCTCRTPFSS